MNMIDDGKRKAEAGRNAFFKWVGDLSPIVAMMIPDHNLLDGYLTRWLEGGDAKDYLPNGYDSWLEVTELIVEAWEADPSILCDSDGNTLHVEPVYPPHGSVITPRIFAQY